MFYRHSYVHRVVKVAASLLLAALLTGCATLFTGTSDEVKFETEPPEATVFIDGIERGKTPTTITVNRDVNDKRVTIEKDGYEDRTFRLQKNFNAVSIINLGNLLFWGIDLISGAVYKYSPTQYSFELDPASASSSDSHKQLVRTSELHNVADLSVDENGELVIPESSDSVIVKDDQRNAMYVFQ